MRGTAWHCVPKLAFVSRGGRITLAWARPRALVVETQHHSASLQIKWNKPQFHSKLIVTQHSDRPAISPIPNRRCNFNARAVAHRNWAVVFSVLLHSISFVPCRCLHSDFNFCKVRRHIPTQIFIISGSDLYQDFYYYYFLWSLNLQTFGVWTHQEWVLMGQPQFKYIMLLHFALLHNPTEFKNEFVGWQGIARDLKWREKPLWSITGSKMSTSLLTSQNICPRKQGKVISRVEAACDRDVQQRWYCHLMFVRIWLDFSLSKPLCDGSSRLILLVFGYVFSIHDLFAKDTVVWYWLMFGWIFPFHELFCDGSSDSRFPSFDVC